MQALVKHVSELDNARLASPAGVGMKPLEKTQFRPVGLIHCCHGDEDSETAVSTGKAAGGV